MTGLSVQRTNQGRTCLQTTPVILHTRLEVCGQTQVVGQHQRITDRNIRELAQWYNLIILCSAIVGFPDSSYTDCPSRPAYARMHVGIQLQRKHA